ncbi:hypothetical protein ACFOZ7_06185 [Natribaculum luteum]|uniref:Uncharacterized protein n=1 Tax=Natribaculum luteum TaxID=1586232 RepID=A0ABD5NWY1_9EURY|nr:hypothetical protein [Natribaculum luteum]
MLPARCVVSASSGGWAGSSDGTLTTSDLEADVLAQFAFTRWGDRLRSPQK